MNLYVTYYSANFVTEVNLDTLIRIGAIDLTPGGGGNRTVDAIVNGNYLYTGRAIAPVEIVKIDLPSFAEVDRLVLPEPDIGGGNNKYMVIVGNILYLAVDRPTGGVNGGIVRINLNTFTRIDRLDLAIRNPQIKTDGINLYVTYWLSTRVDRVPIATFAIDNTMNMANTDSQCMLVYGGFLYNGHGNAGQDRLTRINLTTFAEDASILLDPGEAWIWSLVPDGTYLYCGLASAPGTPGVIVRVDLATFTRVDSLTLPIVGPWLEAERDIWNLYLYGGYLWALCESGPANVVKIGTSIFTRVDGLKLNAGENDSWAGALWEPPAPPAPPAPTPFPINKHYALSREEL